MFWYSGLLTKEFVDYFSDENAVYFTETDSGKMYHDTFKRFRDAVRDLTALSLYKSFEESFLSRITDKDEARFLYLRELAEPFFGDERRPDFTEVYHSIKGNMFECNIDELSADQLAVGMMFPFWSRMGGSFEDEFAESGRLRQFIMALYKKSFKESVSANRHSDTAVWEGVVSMDKLIGFLERLEEKKIYYKLNKVRDAIMVEVAIPGERWEVEFFADGHVEVEKFIGQAEILGEEELERLFLDCD